jgi:23S rRNA pseudouridine2605 synthase
VKVNGSLASLGDKVDVDTVEITVDDVIIQLPEQYRYIKFHKPPGYLSSTRSQGGHPTIFNLVTTTERVYPVGRLDLHSEGLMLLTDDGDLTQRLTHPRYQHEKEYLVLFQDAPSEKHISKWQTGIQLQDGYLTQPSHISIDRQEEGNTWYRIILREGRKRQIRSMASVLGLTVLQLIRVRIASLELGGLASGDWQDCTSEEVDALMAASKLV